MSNRLVDQLMGTYGKLQCRIASKQSIPLRTVSRTFPCDQQDRPGRNHRSALQATALPNEREARGSSPSATLLAAPSLNTTSYSSPLGHRLTRSRQAPQTPMGETRDPRARSIPTIGKTTCPCRSSVLTYSTEWSTYTKPTRCPSTTNAKYCSMPPTLSPPPTSHGVSRQGDGGGGDIVRESSSEAEALRPDPTQ